DRVLGPMGTGSISRPGGARDADIRGVALTAQRASDSLSPPGDARGRAPYGLRHARGGLGGLGIPSGLLGNVALGPPPAIRSSSDLLALVRSGRLAPDELAAVGQSTVGLAVADYSVSGRRDCGLRGPDPHPSVLVPLRHRRHRGNRQLVLFR